MNEALPGMLLSEQGNRGYCTGFNECLLACLACLCSLAETVTHTSFVLMTCITRKQAMPIRILMAFDLHFLSDHRLSPAATGEPLEQEQLVWHD